MSGVTSTPSRTVVVVRLIFSERRHLDERTRLLAWDKGHIPPDVGAAATEAGGPAAFKEIPLFPTSAVCTEGFASITAAFLAFTNGAEGTAVTTTGISVKQL